MSSAVMESAREHPACKSGIKTVLAGFKSFAVSAINARRRRHDFRIGFCGFTSQSKGIAR